MDKKLNRALQELEGLHAAVWDHFDPSGQRGEKDQPKEIKEALKEARKFAKEQGHPFDSFDDERF